MILIIDNYDSFVYNLVQYVGDAVPATHRTEARSSSPVVVRRNDEIDIAGVRELDPDGIIVSPGPGTPYDAGVSMDIFVETEYPTLGVCLGHQTLCAANGVPVGHAPEVVHGKSSTVVHDDKGLFAGLPNPITAGRYHSLAATSSKLSGCIVPTARTDDKRGVLMGVRHAENPHFGIQFHPESILTEMGERMVENFCSSIAAVE
ncbi:anthranilate synthase component II [Halostagnicola bangensis]